MKTFYVTTEEKARELYHPWHGLDLGNGKMLVCVDWRDDHQELHWGDQPEVSRLPHPVFEPNVELSDEHVEHLCGRFNVEKGHCVHHVIKQAGTHDPWMRPHAL